MFRKCFALQSYTYFLPLRSVQLIPLQLLLLCFY